MAGRPLDTLEAALDEPVVVELKDGAVYRGVLAGYDQHLNVVLEPAPGPAEGADAVDNTIVIRGDNVVTIQP
ncbi:MAG: LSM domain-containing protein [Halobacteriales archaeon]|nr:LSM domain-containing protein [Halobacteriales archaeon]